MLIEVARAAVPGGPAASGAVLWLTATAVGTIRSDVPGLPPTTEPASAPGLPGLTSAEVSSVAVLVIALDTATPAVTAGLVALEDTPRSLAERVTINPRAHGELLMPALREAVAEAGYALSEAAAIVVGSGPGPFTGLRVGMVTAASLGQALGIPVHPVCSLDAIAARVSEPVLVATDARRKEVYWAAYDGTHTRTAGPYVCRPDEVDPAELGVSTVAGEKADALAGAAAMQRSAQDYPTPAGLVAAAAPSLRGEVEPEPLVPLYLRRPDAAEPGAPKQVTPTRGDR